MLELTKNAIACWACPRSWTGDGIFIDQQHHFPDGWVPPRGWAGSPTAGHRPIMTVSQNPGHPIEGELAYFTEAGVRVAKGPGDVTDQAARAILDYCSDSYDSTARSKDLIYHKKVIGYVRAAAWLLCQANLGYDFDPRTVSWRALAWITDSFKCSTSRDRAPKIPRELMRQCARRHLYNERAAISPKLIIALGDSARDALCAAGIEHVKMRHPSNGCPALDSPSHDPGFMEMATYLSLAPALGRSSSFMEFRRQVQADLFGQPTLLRSTVTR